MSELKFNPKAIHENLKRQRESHTKPCQREIQSLTTKDYPTNSGTPHGKKMGTKSER